LPAAAIAAREAVVYFKPIADNPAVSATSRSRAEVSHSQWRATPEL